MFGVLGYATTTMVEGLVPRLAWGAAATLVAIALNAGVLMPHELRRLRRFA